MTRKRKFGVLVVLTALAGAILVAATTAVGQVGNHGTAGAATDPAVAAGGTYTPIKHVVVIFQENVSFDHYFGTYPNAANTDGQRFTPAVGTPAVDGLPPATSSSLPPALRHSRNFLTSNPNQSAPARLDSSATGTTAGQGQLTCDQDHDYSDEQKAFDDGRWTCSSRPRGPARALARSGTRAPPTR